MHASAFSRTLVLLFLSGAVLCAQTSSKRRSPTSKFYVAEVEGFAQVNTGDTIEDLTEKSVFDAEGTIIETKPDSANAIVMSNGTGVYFAPNTKIAVKRFLQEPFLPNRTDLDSEPSVSQSQTLVSSGTIGLCTGKLVSGSSMVYDTPHGSINILSQNTQKLSIEVSDEQTTITLFEGAVTLRGDNMLGGESLQPGQQAVIRPRGGNQAPAITIGPIPDDQRGRLSDLVNGACQARQKVYFDVAERQNAVDGAESDLVPQPLLPSDPTDVGPVVSPARGT